MTVQRRNTTKQPADAQTDSLRRAALQAGLAIQEFVSPTSRHVLSNRIRLHYLDWEGAGKRSVLFLHGVGMTAHSFDLVALAMRDEYHCMSLDQRGHGDSEWSLDIDYSIESQAADVFGLVEALDLASVAIVGMSMGGLNAIRFAADHPDRVEALVIVDIGPDIQIVGSDRVKNFLDEPAGLESIDAFIDRAMQFNPRRDPKILRHSLTHNLRRLPDGRWTWKWDPRPLQYADEASEAAARQALWSAVDQIDCPCLVVRGAESDLFGREQAQYLASRLKLGSWVEVSDAGHNVQGDNPTGLVAVIREFLRDRRGKSQGR